VPWQRLIAALLLPAALLPGRPAAAAVRLDVAAVRPGAVWHVVAPGETMTGIARAAGLRVADVARWNQVAASDPVRVDATLRLTPPRVPLRAWRTRVELVTPAMVGWTAAAGCPVSPSQLRRVWVSYIDLQGDYRDGSIVVNSAVVPRVQQVFRTLFGWRYRIMAMSGYSCRPVGGTDVWSEHAYGTAIDLNPLQNPMIRGGAVSPPGGAAGYFWGGGWRSLKDYMHFSVSNR
jgi:D-alanyl-D-alanine carboxypeptidase/LysM domain